jgi:hypothetical protein
VWQLEELIEQAEFVNELEGGWMHGIAAKVAEKIRMLLQNDNAYPGARQEKSKHHSRRSTAGDATLCGQRLVRHD